MAQHARQDSMGEDTVDRSGEVSLSGFTKRLRCSIESTDELLLTLLST